MVPPSWRHAAVHVGPHIRKVSVIRRTRRYRSSARSRGWSSGDSSPSGAEVIYHFTRTGPQRCDSQRATSNIGRRSRSGNPNLWPRDPSQPGCLSILICASMSRITWRESSAMLRRGKSPGPDKRRSSAATSLIVVTARGVMAGSPSRFPTA